ncbi:hypothetical protein [Thermococcus sp.]
MISMAENGRNLNVVEVGREDMALFEVKRERLSGSEARRELEGLREKAEALGTGNRTHGLPRESTMDCTLQGQT